MIDYEALFRAERDKVDELEETIRHLLEADKERSNIIHRWPVHMSPAQQTICLVLLLESSHNRIATTEQLSVAVAESDFAYARLDEWFKKRNNVTVHITNVRKKLRPFKIDIINVWGRGYYIPKDGIEAWKTATERPIQ